MNSRREKRKRERGNARWWDDEIALRERKNKRERMAVNTTGMENLLGGRLSWQLVRLSFPQREQGRELSQADFDWWQFVQAFLARVLVFLWGSRESGSWWEKGMTSLSISCSRSFSFSFALFLQISLQISLESRYFFWSLSFYRSRWEPLSFYRSRISSDLPGESTKSHRESLIDVSLLPWFPEMICSDFR